MSILLLQWNKQPNYVFMQESSHFKNKQHLCFKDTMATMYFLTQLNIFHPIANLKKSNSDYKCSLMFPAYAIITYPNPKTACFIFMYLWIMLYDT